MPRRPSRVPAADVRTCRCPCAGCRGRVASVSPRRCPLGRGRSRRAGRGCWSMARCRDGRGSTGWSHASTTSMSCWPWCSAVARSASAPLRTRGPLTRGRAARRLSGAEAPGRSRLEPDGGPTRARAGHTSDVRVRRRARAPGGGHGNLRAIRILAGRCLSRRRCKVIDSRAAPAVRSSRA